ncbi:MAG: MFS transporter, partial [Leptospiraceae bacterium]|nr:MFS transporter [Leptospiraceae bacterium]
FPILFSLTGDLFRTENRPTASAWVGLAMSLGMAFGQMFAGSIAHSTIFGLEGWRFSFIAVAVPAFPVVALFYYFAQLPEHGAADEGAGKVDLEHNISFSMESLTRVFRVKTNVLAFLQGIPGTIPWGFLFVFAVDFFEKNKGWDVNTGNTIVLLFGGMSILGGFLGGFIGKKLYAANRRLFPAFCSLTVIVGAIPVFYLVNYQGESMLPAFIASFVGGLVVPMTGANVRAILINTNLPENRGAVFGFFNLTDDLGKGLGPFFIGLFVSVMPALAAYNLAIAMWIVCGLVWVGIVFTMNDDEDRVTEELRIRGKA